MNNTAESGLDININGCNDKEDEINGGIGTSEPLINSEFNGGFGASEPLNEETSLTPINPTKSQIDDMVEKMFVLLRGAEICMYLYVLIHYIHI